MKKLQSTGIIFIILFLTNACVSHKKTIYVQDQGKKLTLKEYEISREITEVVQPGDELYITVSTSDERPTNFSRAEIMGYDVVLRSYAVADDGTIRFPYLGTINVLGQTIIEVADEIEEALSSYITTPSVSARFVNQKVTVIGEVATPGVYTFYEKNINILQAIAYAGDINTFGNKKEVVLIREE